MERWLITNKLILIIFISLTIIYSEAAGISWNIFLLLIYFCLNISMHMFKKNSITSVLLLLSMALTIVASIYTSPFFMLLLPLSIIELLDKWKVKTLIVFVLMVVPVFYSPPFIQPVFILVVMYTFFTYTMGKVFHHKLMKNQEDIDNMRTTQQRLMKQIHENDAYIKQSAYMYKLEERNRISQEIHDDIGHSITGALIQMEAAKRMIKRDQGKATELLQNAIGITQDGIEQIRLTLKNMKPTIEQVGINRLKLYINKFAVKHDKRTILTYNGDMDRITHIQWKIIQENVTEALTNAMKYAQQSTMITVDVVVLNKLVRVEVKDNGKGAERIEKGLGIIGMEERTASVDGKIIITGNQGFSVTMLLPITS